MRNDYNFSHSDSEFLAAQTEYLSGNQTEYLSGNQTEYFSGNSGTVDWDQYILHEAASYILPPETSPQIRDISAHLIKTFTTRETYMKFLSHREDSAQDLLDLLQNLLDHARPEPQFRKLLYVALVRLCRKSELCPRSFYLQAEGVHDKAERPHSDGHFGDVYEAKYKGNPVALKVIKLYTHSDRSQLLKAFSREAVVWAQLSHPNIVPFYGILDSAPQSFCLVSLWSSRGDVTKFLVEQPNTHRPRLIYGIAAGMEYLHKNGVVHGDLKPPNILVAEHEQPLLTDFGFSYVTDDNGLQGLSSSQTRGSTRDYDAPERLEELQSRRTSESDVFAFGMSCYELFIHPPLANKKPISVPSAHLKIVGHNASSLERFTEYSGRGLTNGMWKVLERCWSHKPSDRPTATGIKELLSKLSPIETTPASQEWSVPSRPGFESSGGQIDNTIQRALSHLQTL